MKTQYHCLLGYVYALLAISFTWGFTSCDNDVNDWEVDKNYEALFRGLEFDLSKAGSNDVLLQYTQIMSAQKYIFEFYTDSCEFLDENYFRTDTVWADTLTVFSNDATPMKVQYRTWFVDLNGSTQYSVRMKGVSETGLESGYSETAFKTSAEQLFEKPQTGETSVTLSWTYSENVTHLMLWKKNILPDGEDGPQSGEEEVPEWEEVGRYDLDANAITNHTYTIENLTSGTNYRVRIYNDEALRGEYQFKTLGLGKGVTIEVPQSTSLTDTIDMAQLFEDYQVNGQAGLTLKFQAGGLYVLGTLKLPSVDNVLLTSSSSNENDRPHLICDAVQVSTTLESLRMEYVDLDGNGRASFMVQPSVAVNSIEFEGCMLRNMKNSVVRVNISGAQLEGITINNCIVKDVSTSGWGMINIGGNVKLMDHITVTNNTLINVGDHMMDVRPEVNTLTLSNNTIYLAVDCIKYLNDVFMFDGSHAKEWPHKLVITDNIFSGPNQNTVLHSGYGSYSRLDFSEGNYITSDLREGGNAFKNINKLTITSDELFVDPLNGDFHIKSDAGFAGQGTAGDPRWY